MKKIDFETGFVPELQELVKELAGNLYQQSTAMRDAAGPPWGSEQISRAEALSRMEEFEDPAKVAAFEKMSDATLAKAALQAIKLRKGAGETRDFKEEAMKEPPLVPTEEVLGQSR